MGKHHRHGWKTMFRGEPGRDFPIEAERQPADAESQRTVETARDASGTLSDHEQSLRQAGRADREPADDFQFAARPAGDAVARPDATVGRGDNASEAVR